jgi:hypothetical protein
VALETRSHIALETLSKRDAASTCFARIFREVGSMEEGAAACAYAYHKQARVKRGPKSIKYILGVRWQRGQCDQ